MSEFYISEIIKKEEFTAANKARNDVEMYFQSKGYKILNTYCNILNTTSNYSASVQAVKELIALLKTIKKNDSIYFQYPYYERHNKMGRILNIAKKIKKLKYTVIVHDLNSLRHGRDDENVKTEIERLNNFENIISHNKEMTKWLREHGCKSNIVELEVFDYLLDKEVSIKNKRNTDIVFAGNLDKKKSGFIYNLIKEDCIDCKVNLYGPNFEGCIEKDNIKYKGCFDPEELIEKLEGKYGLIWDGVSLEECAGTIGNYTKYNNPHKLSMYIVAELPIICWSQMAIANFVRENKIGICIDRLSDINNELNKITEKDYNIMLNNILSIKSDLINNQYIDRALKKLRQR